MAERNPAVATLSPLHQIKAGRTVRIRELCGSPEQSCRLRELGLGEGQIIRLRHEFQWSRLDVESGETEQSGDAIRLVGARVVLHG